MLLLTLLLIGVGMAAALMAKMTGLPARWRVTIAGVVAELLAFVPFFGLAHRRASVRYSA